jgi:hypothetical protein
MLRLYNMHVIVVVLVIGKGNRMHQCTVKVYVPMAMRIDVKNAY